MKFLSAITILIVAFMSVIAPAYSSKKFPIVMTDVICSSPEPFLDVLKVTKSKYTQEELIGLLGKLYTDDRCIELPSMMSAIMIKKHSQHREYNGMPASVWEVQVPGVLVGNGPMSGYTWVATE